MKKQDITIEKFDEKDEHIKSNPFINGRALLEIKYDDETTFTFVDKFGRQTSDFYKWAELVDDKGIYFVEDISGKEYYIDSVGTPYNSYPKEELFSEDEKVNHSKELVTVINDEFDIVSRGFNYSSALFSKKLDKFLTGHKYKICTSIHNNKFVVRAKEGEYLYYTYLDINGNEDKRRLYLPEGSRILNPEELFTENTAVVYDSISDMKGIVDKNFCYLIPPRFKDISNISHGIAVAKVSDKDKKSFLSGTKSYILNEDGSILRESFHEDTFGDKPDSDTGIVMYGNYGLYLDDVIYSPSQEGYVIDMNDYFYLVNVFGEKFIVNGNSISEVRSKVIELLTKARSYFENKIDVDNAIKRINKVNVKDKSTRKN